MKHLKMTAILCALALTGAVMPKALAADAEAAAAAVPAATAAVEEAAPVDYTDALLKGLSVTLPDVQAAVESGTFTNLSPQAPKPVEPEPEPIPEPEPEPEVEPEPEPEPEPVAPAGKYTADQGSAANEITTDGAYDEMTYTSEKADENALRVSMAYITAKGDTFTKSGDASGIDSSDLYGLNAALLVTHGGHGAFTDAKISTEGLGAVGAYGYSKGTYVNLNGAEMTTNGLGATAVAVSERAMMKVQNSTISTKGDQSPAIKIAKNGGMILTEDSTFVTSGLNSQGIVSNGNVTITGGSVKAEQTKAAVVRNINTISLEGATLEGNEVGPVPYNIVMYADADAIGTMGTQQFEAKDSALISHNGGMFYVTGTHCRITLNNTTIEQDPALPVFTIIGNDGAFGWGTPGTNGGHVELILSHQTLTGNILVDSISDVNLNVREGSVWTGAIDIVPNADGGDAYKTNADVFIAEGSTWNLTADSKVSSLFNLGTINYNGHTITLADGTVMAG